MHPESPQSYAVGLHIDAGQAVAVVTLSGEFDDRTPAAAHFAHTLAEEIPSQVKSIVVDFSQCWFINSEVETQLLQAVRTKGRGHVWACGLTGQPKRRIQLGQWDAVINVAADVAHALTCL